VAIRLSLGETLAMAINPVGIGQNNARLMPIKDKGGSDWAMLGSPGWPL